LPRALIPLFLIPYSPPSMLSLTAGSSSTSFYSTSRTEFVLNNSSIAECLKLSFQQVVTHPDRTPNKRVTPFLLCWCKLSQADFRMCDAQRFSCNFLRRSPKMLILDGLETRLNGALEYPIFNFFTSLNMCSILMKTSVLLSGFWRC
jgi:1-deoxy-D-xylulose 5-phosphate reductoisomerase